MTSNNRDKKAFSQVAKFIFRLLKIKNLVMNFVLKSYQGYTLLHEAAADGNLSAIKFLVKNGADLALHGPCGQTAAGWCEERFVINFSN